MSRELRKVSAPSQPLCLPSSLGPFRAPSLRRPTCAALLPDSPYCPYARGALRPRAQHLRWLQGMGLRPGPKVAAPGAHHRCPGEQSLEGPGEFWPGATGSDGLSSSSPYLCGLVILGVRLGSLGAPVVGTRRCSFGLPAHTLCSSVASQTLLPRARTLCRGW